MVTLASRVWYLSWVLGVFYPGRPYNWGGGAERAVILIGGSGELERKKRRRKL